MIHAASSVGVTWSSRRSTLVRTSLASRVTVWPGATFAIGPPIEDGFYYDFEFPGGRTFNDDALVAIDAISKATELTGPAVRDAIEKTKDFPGVAGVITLDADHNAVKSAVVIGIEKNAPKYVATVNP